MSKQFKGIIRHLRKIELTEDLKEKANKVYGENLGYYYGCQFIGHPQFGTTSLFAPSHTSLVVKEYTKKKKKFVETLNSVYQVEE